MFRFCFSFKPYDFVNYFLLFLFPDATGDQNKVPLIKSLFVNERDKELIKTLLNKMDHMEEIKCK